MRIISFIRSAGLSSPLLSLHSREKFAGFETEQAEIEADRVVLEAKTEEKNTLIESIDELKEGLETKKGEVKKMENDLVGKNAPAKYRNLSQSLPRL